ncbi:hypothetical protein FHS85_001473 [Rhodoligotrophos appendicifer]|uniref:SIMPL domain-containing protein n=1 Tax=Rhodoligotrophos appendicifer TaxID=987056 RepID=UPI0011870B61|nr:SIMPL domain-containing protein [Rhodoligotrophos appendicifer]
MSSRSLTPSLLALGLVTCLVGVSAAEAPARAETPPRTLSLTGTGEVKAVPDQAMISIGVVEQAATAAAALSANNAAMAEIMATLKAAAIGDRDIQTANFSVSPRYVYPKEGNEPPRIEGYEVSNQVTVRVRDLAKLGGVLDKVVSSGSNQINGISFLIADRDTAENEARRLAVADAKAKADLYAAAAGVTLGPVYSLSENGGYQPPQPMMRQSFAKAAPDSVPIAQGEQTVSIEVNITWQLK